MEEQVILDFCGHCGVLLPEGGAHQDPEPRCLNCGANVGPREFRCQGTFSKTDAERLRNAE